MDLRKNLTKSGFLGCHEDVELIENVRTNVHDAVVYIFVFGRGGSAGYMNRLGISDCLLAT